MLVCRVKWNFVGRLRIPKKPDRPMISQIIEQSVFKQVSGPWHKSFFTSMLGGKDATSWLFIFVCVEKNLKTIISYINAHTYVHTHRRKEKNNCRLHWCYILCNFIHMHYMCVWIPMRVHKIHPVGSEANEIPRRLNSLFWGEDEMVELFKALNFLRSDRCCPRFEFISFYH